MKVIFLDMDGVLNTNRTILLREKFVELDDIVIGFNQLDKEAVAQLNRVTDETGAKIVISSSWRIGCAKPERFNVLVKHLQEQGVKGQVIGRTPIDTEYSPKTPAGYTLFTALPRGKEIQLWLNANPGVEKFVIVDDMSDMEHLTNKLVMTAFEVGITKENADNMIELLK